MGLISETVYFWPQWNRCHQNPACGHLNITFVVIGMNRMNGKSWNKGLSRTIIYPCPKSRDHIFWAPAHTSGCVQELHREKPQMPSSKRSKCTVLITDYLKTSAGQLHYYLLFTFHIQSLYLCVCLLAKLVVITACVSCVFMFRLSYWLFIFLSACCW